MVLVLLTSELLHVYTPSCTLYSSSDTRMLKIQRYKCKTRDFHTFSCFGPHIWNSFSQDLRHCSTLSSFEAKLKIFLFSQYFRHNYYQYPVSATVILCACVCVCFHILPYVNCFGRTMLYMCIEYHTLKHQAGKQKDLCLVPLQLSFLFKNCDLWTLSCTFVPCPINDKFKWLSSLPTIIQESFWW